MNPWAETAGVVFLALLGFAAGRWFSQRPPPYWSLGFFIPFLLVVGIGLSRWFSALEFVVPIKWLVAGRTEFALTAIIATMVLTTPASRLPRARERLAVYVFMVCLVLNSSIWPFLAPAFNHQLLVHLKTRIDSDGVCLQNTNYTCGPASAVTGLRVLGINAEEGELAILAHTSVAMGTPPDILAEIITRRYSTNGVAAEYRHFKAVGELRAVTPTLVVIKFGLLVDHYVTVLSVNDRVVVVGDPVSGKARLTIPEFEAIWRYTGVILRKQATAKL